MATATPKKHENLTQALAAFQAELPSIGLDAENPHFRSKFATLSNVTKEVLPLLSKQGLAFSVGTFVKEGQLILDAHLLHETGTSRSAQFPINETNPQKVGSAVTYYRRYALAALTGVVADLDDDGNAASTESPAQRQVNQAKARPAPKKAEDKNAPAGVAAIKAKIGELIQQDKATPDEANALVEQKSKELSKPKNSVEVYEAVLAEIESR